MDVSGSGKSFVACLLGDRDNKKVRVARTISGDWSMRRIQQLYLRNYLLMTRVSVSYLFLVRSLNVLLKLHCHTTPVCSGYENLGYRIDFVHISGRSGSDTNARLIAEALDTIPIEADERLLLLGYSKGTVDILHFLANYPQQARRVSAVFSVAGPVYGSPLADMSATFYGLFAAYLPLARCGPGDHLVLADLRSQARFQWLATHTLPSHVQYFSLVALAERERIARTLYFPLRSLARIDLQNDGQVLARGAILPGSTLLGYARADHWEVAISIEEEFPFLAGRPGRQDKFPRDALFEALVLFVIEHLHSHASEQ